MSSKKILFVFSIVGIAAAAAFACNCKPPVAIFTFSPNNACLRQTVGFNGSGSYDPDGTSLTYNWNFGSGATDITGANTATPSCKYTTAGNKTVTLTVTDSDSTINCPPNKTSPPYTLTVTVVGVGSVSASPTNTCVGQNAVFTAVATPSGKPMNCLEWQKRWKDANSQTWGQWQAVQSSANPQISSSSVPGYCQYRARNGGTDSDWKVSPTVTFVGVDKIEINASGWDDVTSRTIVLMRGTKYQFRATPTPSGASWPSGAPVWSGIKEGTGQTIDVTFTDGGTFELKASCCGGGEKKVTISVITPVVDEVTYGGGNFPLTRLQYNGTTGKYDVVSVEVPEYKRDPSGTGTPAYRANPACWKAGSDATAKVKFWYNENLSYPASDIVVRAETSDDGFNIGDWGDSSAATWAANWSTEATCTSEMTIDDTVQLQGYTAQWRYKCTSGSNSWIDIVTPTVPGQTTQPSKLYVVLDTPQDPQAQPWVELLDHACGSIAEGASDAAEAMGMLWGSFFYDAGGVYDTVDGSPSYAWRSNPGGNFILKTWLDIYGSGIGTVNCHDMAQAEVIYGNALGCGATQSYVSPFGYLNCIKPIGCGWTNNPFYSAGPPISSSPVVDGDWGVADGRSGFGNHSFATLNGWIYDASVGRVDNDSDPDDPPHPWFPRTLNGNDTWLSNYKTLVIDNFPAVSTGTPGTVAFGVDPE